MRKAIIIILIFVVFVAIVVGVYFGYQKTKNIVSPVTNQNQGTLPIGQGGASSSTTNGGAATIFGGSDMNSEDLAYFQDQKQRLSIMTTQPVVGYWVTISKSTSTPPLLFYLDQKGEVVQVNSPGKENIIASSSFGAPLKTLQNIDGSKVIVFFNSGMVAIFDAVSKVWQSLDSGILSVAFSSDGKSIAYLKPNGAKTSLYTQNIISSKKTVTLVATLNIQDFSISWPSANILILLPKPSNQFYGQAWYFDLKNKTLNQLGSGQGFDSVFSQKSDFAMQFVSAERSKIAVSITNGSGKKLADMPFSTVAQKCSFAQDSAAAFCAIPIKYSIDYPVLPDDYLKQVAFSSDAIYKIDLSSSVLTKIVDSQTALFDAIDLRAVSSTLYFVNRIDGMLYGFNL